MEVRQGGGHGSLHLVPGMLLCVHLVADGQPGCFHMLEVVRGPVVEQGVQPPDVVDNDLVAWVRILFAVLVIDDVRESPLVQAQVCG